MKIHEYQAKDLLEQYGIPVLKGEAVFSVQEAVEAAQRIGGGAWRLKAQVQADISDTKQNSKLNQVVRSVEIVKVVTNEILASFITMPDRTISIRRILIEEFVDMGDVLHFSVMTDHEQLEIIWSLYSKYPISDELEHILGRTSVKPFETLSELKFFQMLENVKQVEFLPMQLWAICSDLDKLYRYSDAICFHFSVAYIAQRHRMEVVDIQMEFDNNALFRHPEINVLKDLDEEDPDALEASFYNTVYTRLSLKSGVGCVSHGGGLTLSLVDLLCSNGATVTAFADLDGMITEEKLISIFDIMARDPSIHTIVAYFCSDMMSHQNLIELVIDAMSNADSLSYGYVDSPIFNTPIMLYMKSKNGSQGLKIEKKENFSTERWYFDVSILNVNTLSEFVHNAIRSTT